MTETLPFPERRVLARHSAIVLGGGLSGLAAAHRLAREGWQRVLVIERGPTVGGLAGSFEREGHWYPLGYHHILQRDRTLLSFLALLGITPTVRWRRIRVLFEIDGRLHDLGSPAGFARFPMALTAKVRFIRLMLRAFAKSDWSDWEGRPARELLDAWGGPAVRERLFEPLCRLKFQRSSADVSAAWLGARLHFREGATPLGYTPGASWTKLLCDGMGALVEGAGVEIRTSTTVASMQTRDGRATGITLATGERIGADVIVNTLPPPTYLAIAQGDDTPHLSPIRYTALLSAVCAAPLQALPPFYWLNVTSPGATACGIFRLDALNPTIGRGDEMCINFVTHLTGRRDPLFTMADAELTALYLADYARVFGRALAPSWVNITRVPMYSPVFDRAFRNPPVQSVTWPNVYFAGNYRTFPSVASTGTALESGIIAADRILRDWPRVAGLPKAA